MLILSRRVGEKLLIGDNVVVTILGVKYNQVRVGIDAPKEVVILRSEIKRFERPKADGNETTARRGPESL